MNNSSTNMVRSKSAGGGKRFCTIMPGIPTIPEPLKGAAKRDVRAKRKAQRKARKRQRAR